MFRRSLFVVVLLVAGIVSANGAYSPSIDDGAMTYFGARTSFYSLTVRDGALVATLSTRAFPGAIAHNFTAIPSRPSGDVNLQTVSAMNMNPSDAARAWAAQLTHLRQLAGINYKNSAWTIKHGTSSLDGIIAAYSNWFASGGLSLTQDRSTSTSNVVAYDLTGLSDQLRVVFHNVDGGVQVSIAKK